MVFKAIGLFWPEELFTSTVVLEAGSTQELKDADLGVITPDEIDPENTAWREAL